MATCGGLAELETFDSFPFLGARKGAQGEVCYVGVVPAVEGLQCISSGPFGEFTAPFVHDDSGCTEFLYLNLLDLGLVP